MKCDVKREMECEMKRAIKMRNEVRISADRSAIRQNLPRRISSVRSACANSRVEYGF